MKDYAELEKRLRARKTPVHGSAGLHTIVLSYVPDALANEAADAISELKKRCEALELRGDHLEDRVADAAAKAEE